MFRKALIAVVATAALAAGASAASAKTHVDFNIGIGTPGFYYGTYPAYGYYPVYDDDCHYVKVKKWVKYKGAWHKKYVKKLVCY